MNPLVIFHSQCPDGFTAAWVVRGALNDLLADGVDFHPGVYGQDPPDCTGRSVYMVDFTYPPDQMLAIYGQASSLVVLDHHQTAYGNCLPMESRHAHELLYHGNPTNYHIELDMDRSGARLAWDYFYVPEEPPDIVRFVEDRDLWRFRYEDDTKDYHAALTSRPYTFEAWDKIAATPLDTIFAEGAAINRYRDQLIAQAVALTTVQEVCGIRMPVTNCPYAYASDVAGINARIMGVSAYYFDDLANGVRQWGLRSTPDGPDVAALAETMGGGGHRHAAGFKTAIPR